MKSGIGAIVLVLLLVLCMFVPPASADGGMIPVTQFTVYEPGQKAIIGWNGTTEIMILSVDVYGSEVSHGLHFVPFPTIPDVELGSVESFEELNKLLEESMWSDRNHGALSAGAEGGNSSVEIVFHEEIGPHDLSLLKVNDYNHFSEWVEEFLSAKGYDGPSMPDNLEEAVAHYLENDIRYFAFDLVEIAPETKSVDPLVYTFETDSLFFPLEISSIITGDVEITLALLSPYGLAVDYSGLVDMGFHHLTGMNLDHEEVERISEDVGELLPNTARLEVYENTFHLSDLEGDVWGPVLEDFSLLYTGSSAMDPLQEDLNGDGVLDLILSIEDRIVAVDGRTGAILWVNACLSPSSEPEWGAYTTYTSLIDVEEYGVSGVLIVKNVGVWFLEQATGRTVWRYDFIEEEWYAGIHLLKGDGSSRVLLEIDLRSSSYSGGYYYTSSERETVCLDLASGERTWSLISPLRIFGCMDINGDGEDDILRTDGSNLQLIDRDAVLIWESGVSYNMLYPLLDVNEDGWQDIPYTRWKNGQNVVGMLNGASGGSLWETDVGTSSSCMFIPEEKRAVLYGDMLRMVDMETGEIKWKSPYSNYICSIDTCDINGDGTKDILFSTYSYGYPSGNSTLSALDGRNGITIWDRSLPDTRVSSVIIEDTEERAMVCSSSYLRIECIGIQDGNERWNLTAEDFGSIQEDNYYYRYPTFSVRDGALYLRSLSLYEIGWDGSVEELFSSGEWVESFFLPEDLAGPLVVRTRDKLYVSGALTPIELEADGGKETDDDTPLSIFIVPVVLIIVVVLAYLGLIKRRRQPFQPHCASPSNDTPGSGSSIGQGEQLPGSHRQQGEEPCRVRGIGGQQEGGGGHQEGGET
ncbi:MAG: DUF2330 domain-containing protein [Thermoplasmata archaeon]|nr:DUF2330 domain-containing protein [Thermoplasmata archaeon]